MPFMYWLRERIVDIAQLCLDAFFLISDWVWPFDALAEPFLGLYYRFIDFARDWLDFEDWVSDTVTRLGEILSTWDIWSYFQWWFVAAENAWNWVSGAINNVINIVDVWWSTASQVVLSWVEEAKLFAQELVSNVESWLNNLQTDWDNFWTLTWPQWVGRLSVIETAWDNFWTITFPTLATWSGVSALIDSTLTSWFPFYDELAALWGEISDFFSDPLQWVYNKMDEFIERFW